MRTTKDDRKATIERLTGELRAGTINRRDFMKLAGLVGGLTVAGGMGLFGTRPAFGADAIRVGCLFPQSGNMALLGNESSRGVELATEEWNAKGGIKGRPIQLIMGDAPDPKSGVTDAERLITNEKVLCMIGTYASGISYAVTEVANRHKTIFMETTAVADNIVQRGFPYLFRNTGNTTGFGSDAVKYALDLAPQLGTTREKVKAAIVFEDSLWGTSVSDAAIKAAKEHKLNVVATESYNAPKAVDLSSVILRLRDAKPDVIIHTAYMTDAILFWRQAKENNLEVKCGIGTSAGYGISGFAEGLGEISDGLMSVDYTQTNTNPAFAAKLPAFVAAYKKKYNTPPRSGQSIASFDAANSLYMGMTGAKELTADEMRKALLALDVPKYSTATGWGVKFDDKTGQNTRVEYILFQWKKQQQWTVMPEKARMQGVTLDLPLKPWAKRA